MTTDRAIFTVQSVLTKVSATPLAPEQINRATAFIRAQKGCFYDHQTNGQCMTLDQFESNKGVILTALGMLPEGSIRVNGYKVRYNPLWGKWQCRYDGVLYEEFKDLADAVDHCRKG